MSFVSSLSLTPTTYTHTPTCLVWRKLSEGEMIMIIRPRWGGRKGLENQTHPADPSYCVLTLWSEILKIIYLVISTVRQKLKNIRIKLPAAYLLIVCVWSDSFNAFQMLWVGWVSWGGPSSISQCKPPVPSLPLDFRNICPGALSCLSPLPPCSLFSNLWLLLSHASAGPMLLKRNMWATYMIQLF